MLDGQSDAATIRVGVVGVGNCASALIQGISHYGRCGGNEPAPGLITSDVGGYRVRDIEIAAAFDVSAHKVGRDLADAIWAAPNNTFRFCDVTRTGVEVMRGPTLDGVGRFLAEDVPLSCAPEVDVAEVLRASGTQVVVSYLPVGSQQATEFYAGAALAAGCAFVNCVPVFIASQPVWQQRFAERGLPLIGDDIKSQVGATIVHRTLVNLMRERGIALDRTYQLNFGGNADFRNMLERERLESKRLSKTRSVNSQLDVPLEANCIHISPSDHVAWLTDRKVAYIRLEGTAFGGVPLSMEVKLEVWDSPNSAGVVMDAIRCARLALDRGEGGAIEGPSSYYMKSPPRQYTDEEARERTRAFIAGRPSQGRA